VATMRVCGLIAGGRRRLALCSAVGAIGTFEINGKAIAGVVGLGLLRPARISVPWRCEAPNLPRDDRAGRMDPLAARDAGLSDQGHGMPGTQPQLDCDVT
jgi:hypothetical protein